MKTIWNGITKENPTFALFLGLCPALAVTNNFESAYVMGICVLVILLFSNTIISLLRKLIPEPVKIPVFILIIGTFVTALELLLHAYLPNLYQVLGIYLPLIVVNCIVLGRAINVASKEKVGKSILDALGIGLGFLLAMMLLGLFREVLGNNTLTLMDQISPLTGYKAVYTIFPVNDLLPFSILKSSAGAFLTLGLFLGIFSFFRKEESK